MKRISIILLALTTVVVAEAKSPTKENSSRSVVVAELPSSLDFAGEQVPLEYQYVREALEREMLTTSNMHTGTMLALRYTGRYFPVIEPILKKHGVPDDFKYLCMAESGLNPNAQSPARAAGLWQFVSSAAKEYGLETGDNTDMRYNVERATEAACRYLKDAYKRFGSWTLAAASYNAGRAGVARRLDVQGVENYWDLFLPEETMRYVPRILSFKMLLADPSAYGFDLDDEDYFRPFENYKTIVVESADIDWSAIAHKHNTTYRQLRILNPWIRSYEYSNKGNTRYEVKIPTANFKRLGY